MEGVSTSLGAFGFKIRHKANAEEEILAMYLGLSLPQPLEPGPINQSKARYTDVRDD